MLSPLALAFLVVGLGGCKKEEEPWKPAPPSKAAPAPAATAVTSATGAASADASTVTTRGYVKVLSGFSLRHDPRWTVDHEEAERLGISTVFRFPSGSLRVVTVRSAAPADVAKVLAGIEKRDHLKNTLPSSARAIPSSAFGITGATSAVRGTYDAADAGDGSRSIVVLGHPRRAFVLDMVAPRGDAGAGESIDAVWPTFRITELDGVRVGLTSDGGTPRLDLAVPDPSVLADPNQLVDTTPDGDGGA